MRGQGARSGAPPTLDASAASHGAGRLALLEPRRPDRGPIAVLAASASLGAAVVHAAVVPEHDDWAPSAGFFGALASYQLMWALALLLRTVAQEDLWTGAAVNAAAVAVWLLSRTAGLPFGPHGGQPEPFARSDVLASLLGLIVIGGAVAMATRPRGLRVPRPRIAGATAAASVTVISALALSGAAGHAHTPHQAHLPGIHEAHTHVVPTTPKTESVNPSSADAAPEPVPAENEPTPPAAHADAEGDSHVH